MVTMRYTIIDVRESDEFAQGHVLGALNIPPDQLLAGAPQIADLPKDTPLLLYCKSGARSNSAIHILKQLGFTNLTNGINKDQVAAKYLIDF